MKISFYIVLCIAFIDYLGVGLVFPIFPAMVFDAASPLLEAGTTVLMRGLVLGALIAAMPFAQFFSAPMWGAVSDHRGRKGPLVWSLSVALVGYAVGAGAVWMESLSGLFLSRLIVGMGTGNMAIVQAAIADVSTDEEKGKHFSLYGMAMGTGFTLGPFFGGWLSRWGYAWPFVFAAMLVCVNWAFVYVCFRETLHLKTKKTLSWIAGFVQVKKAFKLKGLRTILLCSFLGIFGWCYFFELIPVFLISRFGFSTEHLGSFFGISGGFYALSTGVLIRPLVKRYKAEHLMCASMLLTGVAIACMALAPSVVWMWLLILLITYLTAPFSPTSTTVVSNGVPAHLQGEALGILASVNAAAFALSPLCSGSFVGDYPTLPMWIGGSLMFLGGVILWLRFYVHRKNGGLKRL